MMRVKTGFAFLAVEAFKNGGSVFGQLGECAGRAPVRPDAAVWSCTSGGPMAVPMTRSAHRRVVAVLHLRTSVHAGVAGPEVTAFLALVLVLSRPISDERIYKLLFTV